MAGYSSEVSHRKPDQGEDSDGSAVSFEESPDTKKTHQSTEECEEVIPAGKTVGESPPKHEDTFDLEKPFPSDKTLSEASRLCDSEVQTNTDAAGAAGGCVHVQIVQGTIEMQEVGSVLPKKLSRH